MQFDTRAKRALLLAWLIAGCVCARGAEIVVAQVAPLTGAEANQGRGYAAGMQLYFNAVNKSGGAGGNTFRLVRRDDGSQPEVTVSMARSLLAEDDPIVLAGVFGAKSI